MVKSEHGDDIYGSTAENVRLYRIRQTHIHMCIYRQTQTGRQTDGWIDGWMDGWTDR